MFVKEQKFKRNKKGSVFLFCFVSRHRERDGNKNSFGRVTKRSRRHSLLVFDPPKFWSLNNEVSRSLVFRL